MKEGKLKFTIQKGNIQQAVAFSRQIPEFESPYDEAEYHKRLGKVSHLILIAYDKEKPIGFKAGYQKGDLFYTWMGGVLPEYRQSGVAKALATEQEKWVRQSGWDTIELKTWNQAKAMLLFAIKDGFNIVDVEPKSDINKNRIILRKKLS